MFSSSPRVGPLPNQWGAPHLYGPQLFLPEDSLLPTKGERGNGSYVSTIAFFFWVFGPFFSFGILEIHPCLREQNMRNEIFLHINVEYIYIHIYLFTRNMRSLALSQRQPRFFSKKIKLPSWFSLMWRLESWFFRIQFIRSLKANFTFIEQHLEDEHPTFVQLQTAVW